MMFKLPTLKIKKTWLDAEIPEYQTPAAAGADLVSTQTAYIHPGEVELIDTGWSMEIPEGYFGALFPRSGLATKNGLRLANCVGVIDSDYRGSVKVALYNDSDKIQVIHTGDRIAQLVIIPFVQPKIKVVQNLSDTIRGFGGFGSTGTK